MTVKRPRLSSLLLIVMLFAPVIASYVMAWTLDAAYMRWWGHTLLCAMLVIAAFELLAVWRTGKTISKLFGRFLREHPVAAIVWLAIYNGTLALGLTLHLVAMR